MKKTLKKAISFSIGMPLCRLPFLRPFKARLLSSWTTPGRRSRLEDILFKAVFSYWTRHEYLAEKDPDRREMMKAIVMGGESGTFWAEHYDSQPIDFEARVGHMSYAQACPLLPELDQTLSSLPPQLVFQMGSSSGREIAWLAKRHTRHQFIGTDIYKEVLDYAAHRHRLPNLSFQKASAKEIPALLRRHGDAECVVFSSGSFQYVQPEHAEALFKELAGFPRLQICVSEPASESEGDPVGIEGSRWRGNLSYTHNYRFYAEKAGLGVETCRIIRPYAPYEDFPMHRHTVRYFLRARAATVPAAASETLSNRPI